jgi:predicted porin
MKFKKLSLALALGSTLVGPAAMAQSSVQLYGKFYPYLLWEKGSGATAVGTPVSTLAATPSGSNAVDVMGLKAGNSRFGMRGTEDMGGGLKGIFQAEAQLNIDDGTGGSSAGALAFNRNTFVGLEGPFGTVKLGNHDTIFKEYGDTIGLLGLSSGTFMSTSNVLRKTGFGTSSASSFHLRRANSVIYETPEIANFVGGIQWSTNEANQNAIPKRDPRVISAGVKWDNDMFYVALAHEIHYDLFGGSANAPSALRNNGASDPTRSKDRATEFVVEWRPNKNHKFEFDAIRKEYKENATTAGRFQSYRNMAYLLAMENRWSDKWRTAAHYVLARPGSCTRVAAACNTDGLEGKQFTVGVAYYLSKRTQLWASASKLVNGKSARYNNNEFDDNPNTGEDLKHYAIGISHSF